MNNQPLVSCIMPTANRRRFVPQAIRYFLSQDYPHCELIIVDDGAEPVEDLVADVPAIRYHRLAQRQKIGAKRNLACGWAQGEIIVHWDDDDWMAPWRISYQVEQLLKTQADICGLNQVLFYHPAQDQAWQYVYPLQNRAWIYGATFCYQKRLWQQHSFPDINVGEDTRFVWASRATKVTPLSDNRFYVGIVHGNNTSPKQTTGSWWHAVSPVDIHALLGEELALIYGNFSSTAAAPQEPQKRLGARGVEPCPTFPSNRPIHIQFDKATNDRELSQAHHERSFEMITIAREADLSLPEYAAFNYGQNLPRMRCWELPFALFQARLPNTASVLNCTINPVGFPERLQALYPHVLYRHWNPIQNNCFAPPIGVPDAAFDRVFCINTLEHLLRAQRAALIEEMARKLKPGGQLILTSDYYFDHFWDDAALLRLGVMRADRQEVFNGFNKVTPQEWLELCQQHDLHPISGSFEEPSEDDATLLRNQPPYPHACIGGVFFKGPQPDLPAGKKIVLALLTWNTRNISIDSVRAYVREGRMLQRLGQAPFICVCDNGSTDGTVEALHAIEAEIDIPFKFIFNGKNLGNSIARNQIIDSAREWDADYLLFMDSDIEIVPFSSFAMLRYMENCGHTLGCIGADSAGQSPYHNKTSRYLFHVDANRVKTSNLVAWTQYGMFRREMFEDGVRFDETNPFDGPGWGFEDNDLAFQMEMKGYLNQHFLGMVYLHRAVRSSVRVMRTLGIDAAALCAKRKQYVVDKWTAVSAINSGPLDYIRRIGTRV